MRHLDLQFYAVSFVRKKGGQSDCGMREVGALPHSLQIDMSSAAVSMFGECSIYIQLNKMSAGKKRHRASTYWV